MSKRTNDRVPPAPSRLGRGLGNLIPVPIQRPTEPVPPSNARVIEVDLSTRGTDAVSAPAAAPTPGRPPAAAPDSAAVSEPRAPRTGGIDQVEFIALAALRPGRYQPRATMDEAGLESLAASIASSGLMQPLVVRAVQGQPGAYEVIAGERRWRALERLGRTEAPAIVRQVADQEAAELSLVENLQREDLNAMDRARALQRLVDEFGLTHQQVATRIGLDRVSVSNLVRLNDLDTKTAGLVREGSLSAGHAKVLVGLADIAQRASLAARAAAGGWSVRQLESEMQREGSVPRGTSTRRKSSGVPSAHVVRLERELQEHLGTRVSVRLTRKKGVGELRIQFFSLDEFDGLMQRIGFRGEDTGLRV
ncbi:MAG: ParB/RepB/Spo0J family partition protein [Phycisphaerae bacterium]|nr:ParB/RepB/Spo0J family partition protein [Phycisphaerae bacterium]